MPSNSKNVWSLDEWYAQEVADNVTYKPGYSMWAWGENEHGALGVNDTAHRSSPVQAGGVGPWVTYNGGYADAASAVKEDGTRWAWGQNAYGMFGFNDGSDSYSSPTQVGTETDWANFRLMDDFAFARKTDGTLWSMGTNSGGALGHNQPSGVQHSSPKQVGTDTNWGYIGSQIVTPTFVKTDGTLWVWGWNGQGQLGQNQAYAQLGAVSSPVQVGTDTDWPLPTNTNTQNISAFNAIRAVIKDNGTLWMWGSGGDGSLGQNSAGTSRSSPVQVGDNDWHGVCTDNDCVLATKTDGTLWGWGNNEAGGLAIPVSTGGGKISSPTQVGTDTTWYRAWINQNSTMAVKTDGTLWAWGKNDRGQLGQNQSYNQLEQLSSPVQIGTLTDWKSDWGSVGSDTKWIRKTM